MRILFFGSGHFGIPTLRNLLQNHDIALVVTQPDRPKGRGLKSAPTPVRTRARELGLDVMAVENVNAPDVVAQLIELRADLGVVIAFGQKIGPALLSGNTGGCINAHASLLPRYRGAAPVHWAIIRGEDKTGVTVFKLVERMDAGPVLTSRWTYIKPEETADELHDRLAGIAVDAVRAALELYALNPNPPGEPQDDAAATAAPRLTKQDGEIHFDRPARELALQICGMWSWPGARCRFVKAGGDKSEEVILCRARVAESPPLQLPPGQCDPLMHVATADGALEILQIKPAGGQLMSWPDFVNGRRVRAGDRFESLGAPGSLNLG